MANRMRRGGAAALFAARMTDEIEIPDDETEEIEAVEEGDEPEDDGVADDPGPSIDYSHAEDEDDGEDEEEDEPAPAVVVPDAVAELRAQLATMQAERDAEKARNAVNDEALELRSHQTNINRAINGARGAMETAKAAFATHSAAGDWTKAAEAQADMAGITADLREFETAADEVKQAVAAFNSGVRRKPADAPKQPQQQTDPFEVAIANLTEKTKDWVRANKADITKSPARGLKAQALDLEAQEQGLKLDSPEYFAYLDKHMGYKTTVTKKPKPTGRAQVAAPSGGRSGAPSGNGGGDGPMDVKLSRAEVEMAKAMNMTTKKYAERKAEIIKNGKDRSRGGPTYSNISHNARR